MWNLVNKLWVELKTNWWRTNLELNEIFRKDVTCDNIKVIKSQGFALSLEDIFLENPQDGQIGPPSPAKSFKG